MLILETIIHETIWGGSRISSYVGLKGDSIGHLYSVFCRREMSNEILNGRWAGKTMNEVFPLFRDEVGMSKYEFFPLTIALTEAKLNLSIQVHPNDEMANLIEHKARGKRESWYFIEAPTKGYIINGCKCIDQIQKKKMLDKKQYLEMCDTLFVQQGDYVFVEPGTLHSITAGSLVYEIEEGADYTYRFYDYDRLDNNGNKRDLHIEKASAALDIGMKSSIKKYKGNEWIAEKTYATKRIIECKEYINDSKSLQCFTLIEGSAKCDGIIVHPGMSVILWPGEKVKNGDIKLAFVARMRRNA